MIFTVRPIHLFALFALPLGLALEACDKHGGKSSGSGGSTTGTTPLAKYGEDCEDGADCQSGFCKKISPVASSGYCSECEVDQDCVDQKTGISCTLDLEQGYALCKDGSLGNACETGVACKQSLICAKADMEVLIPGALPNTCGQCQSSADCTDGMLCSPFANYNQFNFYNTCVAPKSVPNDQLCPHKLNGDGVCISEHCGEVVLQSLVSVSVCGECKVGSDCPEGFTCTPGSADVNGIHGAVCTPPP